MSNNQIRKQSFQSLLAEGRSPASAHNDVMRDTENYVIGKMPGPGLIQFVKIYDNIFSKQQYANKIRGESINGLFDRNVQGYPFI